MLIVFVVVIVISAYPLIFCRLSFSDLLGSGAFGTVHRGVWLHSGSEVVEEEVAVKMMESGASEEERVKFLQEAIIMGQFNHPNIIATLGIIMNKRVSIF